MLALSLLQENGSYSEVFETFNRVLWASTIDQNRTFGGRERQMYVTNNLYFTSPHSNALIAQYRREKSENHEILRKFAVIY